MPYVYFTIGSKVSRKAIDSKSLYEPHEEIFDLSSVDPLVQKIKSLCVHVRLQLLFLLGDCPAEGGNLVLKANLEHGGQGPNRIQAVHKVALPPSMESGRVVDMGIDWLDDDLILLVVMPEKPEVLLVWLCSLITQTGKFV